MTVFSCFSLVFKGQTIFGFVIPECQRFIRKESGSLTHVTNNATHYGTRLSLVPLVPSFALEQRDESDNSTMILGFQKCSKSLLVFLSILS